MKVSPLPLFSIQVKILLVSYKALRILSLHFFEFKDIYESYNLSNKLSFSENFVSNSGLTATAKSIIIFSLHWESPIKAFYYFETCGLTLKRLCTKLLLVSEKCWTTLGLYYAEFYVAFSLKSISTTRFYLVIILHV